MEKASKPYSYTKESRPTSVSIQINYGNFVLQDTLSSFQKEKTVRNFDNLTQLKYC